MPHLFEQVPKYVVTIASYLYTPYPSKISYKAKGDPMVAMKNYLSLCVTYTKLHTYILSFDCYYVRMCVIVKAVWHVVLLVEYLRCDKKNT